jgi:hypothetical protein
MEIREEDGNNRKRRGLIIVVGDMREGIRIGEEEGMVIEGEAVGDQ